MAIDRKTAGLHDENIGPATFSKMRKIIPPMVKRSSLAWPSGTSKCLQMLCASGRFAVPEKILKRSSCNDCSRTVKIKTFSQAKNKMSDVETLRFRGTRTFRARFGPCEDTCRAKLFRKRRFVRPETRQRLGAPTLGPGKPQTPPNRAPPARLL